MSMASQPTGVAQPAHPKLVHEALFYLDMQDYATGIATFLRDGFELAEPALVAVPGSHVDVLRAVMGPDAKRVRFVDMTEAGRNPGRIIPTVLYAFTREHSASRVRIVGEPIWPGRSAAEYRVALQHEALINVALAGRRATILCPYDLQGLPTNALADARRTHPVLLEGGREEVSTDYADPRVVADASLRSLPDSPEWWGDMLVFHSASDLRAIRRFVKVLALRAGLPARRVAELCLAVNEVATNTLVHTNNQRGLLSLWQDLETGSLICEINDSGQLPNRLVGRIPPTRWQRDGRGLILANVLCDLVEIPTGRIGSGTTVRLHMALRAA